MAIRNSSLVDERIVGGMARRSRGPCEIPPTAAGWSAGFGRRFSQLKTCCHKKRSRDFPDGISRNRSRRPAWSRLRSRPPFLYQTDLPSFNGTPPGERFWWCHNQRRAFNAIRKGEEKGGGKGDAAHFGVPPVVPLLGIHVLEMSCVPNGTKLRLKSLA